MYNVQSDFTRKPFVGVCGLATYEEYAALSQYVNTHIHSNDYFVMAGYKLPLEGFTHPIADKALVRPFVHCDFNGSFTDFNLALKYILRDHPMHVKGVQLNVLPWMEVDMAPWLFRLKMQYPSLIVVLQVHERIMIHYSPEEIARKVASLAIDYVMFDASQSRAILYETRIMRTYVAAMYHFADHINVTVAGGLDWSVLRTHFAPLVAEFPRLSCDAFSGLYDQQLHQPAWSKIWMYLRVWNQITA